MSGNEYVPDDAKKVREFQAKSGVIWDVYLDSDLTEGTIRDLVAISSTDTNSPTVRADMAVMRRRFDRWLADHDARIKSEARVAALREAADGIEGGQLRADLIEGNDVVVAYHMAREGIIEMLHARADREAKGGA